MLLLAVLAVGCGSVDLDRERGALLALHAAVRAAHFARDADAMAEQLAPDYIEVSDGRVEATSRAAARERFARYFAAVEFLAWDDLAPPRIEISADGTLASLAVEKLVRLRRLDPTGGATVERTVFAWLATCAKGADGRWRLTAIASTRADEPAATLRAARAALGPGTHAPPVTARAEGRGPDGRAYEIRMALRGPRSMELAWVFDGAEPRPVRIDGDEGRPVTDGKPGEPLPRAEVAVVRAHALPLLPLALEEFFTNFELDPEADPTGDRRLRMKDELGNLAHATLARETDLLRTLELVDATGAVPRPVEILFDSWQAVGGLRFPERVTLRDGHGNWELVLRDLVPDGE